MIGPFFLEETEICYQNLFEPTLRKKKSSDREKLLKFVIEDQEFAFLRSLEQFI